MPDVKWIAREVAEGKPVTVQIDGDVPFLTLDDIEAWLRAEKDKRDRITDLLLFDHLITQVQAMKEGRT